MSIAHLLEDLAAFDDGDPVDMTDVSLEELKLQAFERGYTAGWDDAIKSQIDAQSRITEDLSQNLQDMAFTLSEAQAQLLQLLKPLLYSMLDTVLPQMAQKSLGPHLVAQLEELAGDMMDGSIQIHVNPEIHDTIEKILPQLPKLRVELADDPQLGAGQIQLSVGTREAEINMDSVLSDMVDAVNAFFLEDKKDISHG